MKSLTLLTILVASFLLVASSFAFAAPDMQAYQKRVEKKFLDGVKAANPRVVELKGGLLVEWLKKGDGETSPFEGTSCSMHYHGTLKTGEVFDSSLQRGSPIEFAPNQVVQSWKTIMQVMVPGDVIKIYSPSALAYGARGSPPKIGPNAPLVFRMEMKEVRGNGKTAAEARKLFKELTVNGVDFDSVEAVYEELKL
jgi:FKBP-type peptidyl-prolyl cis-trans isomerase